MSEHAVGNIVEGKVIKITPFGAIVAIDGGGQGLVHISQIANSFVQDINEHLKVDD
ncbi:MAG: S1 RNA-binding domain-containing protein, partial [Anaerotignaceae bacterium]